MNQETQFKLQAFLDNELSETEAREMAALVAREPLAAGLVAELRGTRQAVKAADVPVNVPASREFYWSQIARQIESAEARVDRPTPVPWMLRLQRLLVPLSAVTALAVLTTVSFVRQGAGGGDSSAELEVASQHMGALTYRSQADGMTMVWLYHQGESEFTPVASPDSVEP